MKKLLTISLALIISLFLTISSHAYIDVATFDGKTLYVPTLRNGEDVIYDVELSYVEGTIFKFQKAGKTIATNTSAISMYYAADARLVIDKLQYRFEIFTNVILTVTPEGNLNVTTGDVVANQKASSVEIYNLTSYSDQYFHDLAGLAESKMANLEADVLAVFYPLGEFISADQPPTTLKTSFRGGRFQKILPEQDRAVISSKIEEFLKPSCPQLESWTTSNAKEQANILADWVIAGGGGQSQEAYCPTRRIVFVSIQPDRLPLMENLDLESIIFHELYHGFQQDLVWNCPGNKDSGWIIEAGAEYFAQHLVSEVQGKPQIFGNSLLAQGLLEIERNGSQLADPGIAGKGLIVLRYMMEKDWLDESRILDGSFYHNCERNKELSDSNELVRIAKAKWTNIVLGDDGYRFAE